MHYRVQRSSDCNLSLSFEERRVVLRETLRLLSKELETERLGNVRRLAQIRLFTVLVFFFLHLILGYALQLETFRGK